MTLKKKVAKQDQGLLTIPRDRPTGMKTEPVEVLRGKKVQKTFKIYFLA